MSNEQRVKGPLLVISYIHLTAEAIKNGLLCALGVLCGNKRNRGNALVI